MEIDKKTLEYLNRWGRHEVPTAQVVGRNPKEKLTPGIHQWAAAIGWMFRKDLEPVCCIQFLILAPESFSILASVSLSMPVTKRTELYVNSFLHVVGWDGRVWPHDGDKGWPNGSEDARQVRDLLNKGNPKLGSTLTFPPRISSSLGTSSSIILHLPISNVSKPFPIAPFVPVLVPEGQQAPVENLKRFRALCKDPSPFSLPN
jgi:hypothetical protein